MISSVIMFKQTNFRFESVNLIERMSIDMLIILSFIADQTSYVFSLLTNINKFKFAGEKMCVRVLFDIVSFGCRITCSKLECILSDGNFVFISQ